MWPGAKGEEKAQACDNDLTNFVEQAKESGWGILSDNLLSLLCGPGAKGEEKAQACQRRLFTPV
jgi:hypothetical protein